MAVYVFAPNETDFSTMGLCGPLTPTRCEHQEKRNGLSQLTLVHPIDDAGRWKTLTPGCVLSAEVPVRTTAEIDEDGNLVTTVEKWRMRTTATKAQRGLYSKASGGRRLKTLPVWADKLKTQRLALTVTRKAGRYKVKTKYGSGWISAAAIEHVVTETIPNDPTAIERVEPAWSVKPQLFRIREAELTGEGVTVTASHIFYDLAGNLTTWSGYEEATGANNPTCVEALAGVMAGALMPHEFEGRTNLLDRRVQVGWTNENIVSALMAPGTGILDLWGAELVRDNFEFTILREAGLNRGVRIEHGKNLLGVTVTTDMTDVTARVMPIGRTHKDKPLYLKAGAYNINDETVTIADGEKWVTSARAGDYPAPLMTALETDIKAKSGSSADVLAARKKMIERALELFSIDEADQPSVNVRVEFLKLGDAIEYEQYRRLEDVFLCDKVRVRHPGIGVDVLTEVIETVWDCLSGRFKAIELGRVRLPRERATVPVWQLPRNIPGALVAAGTLDAGVFTDGAGAHLALDGNPATWRVLVMADRATETVGEPQEPVTLSAEVLSGGAPITYQIDEARFIWTRESGDEAADSAWNAAHAGMRTVTVSAAERKVTARYTCAVEAELVEEAE